jgi:hypothetical protein
VHVAMELQKEGAWESDVLDMVANPMRFVRRGCARMRGDGDGSFKCHESSQPRKKKKESKGKRVIVVIQISLAN